MKKILIVDDDLDLLASLQEGLSHAIINSEVIGASSAEDALDILAKGPVNLLITDVHLPGMNGLELIVAAKKDDSRLPIIVMTGFPTQTNERQAMLNGCLRFLEKPFDIDELKKTIHEALADRQGFEGTVAGIELQDLIQLHCLSGGTAAVKVTTADEMGMIFFCKGEIVHAILGDLGGEEAFYRILAFKDGKLESTKNVNAPARTIAKNHMALLMECMRRLDENSGHLTGLGQEVALLNEEDFLGEEQLSTDWFAGNNHDAGSGNSTLPSCFAEFKKVLGYKAAAIMTSPGKMLASESLDDKLNLTDAGDALNVMFREAHEATRKIGMDMVIETVIETPVGVIVMQATGDTDDDLHVISILAADGNKGLMKMKMTQVLPSIKLSFSRSFF